MPDKVEDTANRLSFQVRSGKYGQLGCLPTIERLAGEFEVSKGVIVKAIKLLLAEGLLTRSGYRFYVTIGDLSTQVHETSQRSLEKISEVPLFGPTPRGSQQYYDYILSFPEGLLAPDRQSLSGIVFYVGKGTWYKPHLIQRIDMHEHEAWWPSYTGLGTNWFKVQAIRYVWAAGKSVAKGVLFETSDEKEAVKVEKQAINQYINPYLTNHENYTNCKIAEWPSNDRWQQILRERRFRGTPY